MGRPSEYSEEVAERICELLSENGSVRATCEEVGIARTTLDRWTDENEGFATAIARAKRAGFDNRAEIAVDKAKAGGEPLRARLAFDAERWYLSKIDPKRYGEKISQEISGPDGGPVMAATASLNQEQMDSIAEKIAAARARRE
jgi:hypothetical protein